MWSDIKKKKRAILIFKAKKGSFKEKKQSSIRERWRVIRILNAGERCLYWELNLGRRIQIHSQPICYIKFN